MRIENSFEAPASVAEVWALLTDVPRVVPCMPGAELLEQVDGTTWKATMKVRLGPISMSFGTDVRQEEADAAAHRLRLVADAREARGRGSARAAIEATVAAAGSGSAVAVATDLTLSGAVAQVGRGIVPDVAAQLVAEFAGNLRAQLAGAPAAVRTDPPGGIRLLLRALAARLRPRAEAV